MISDRPNSPRGNIRFNARNGRGRSIC